MLCADIAWNTNEMHFKDKCSADTFWIILSYLADVLLKYYLMMLLKWVFPDESLVHFIHVQKSSSTSHLILLFGRPKTQFPNKPLTYWSMYNCLCICFGVPAQRKTLSMHTHLVTAHLRHEYNHLLDFLSRGNQL